MLMVKIIMNPLPAKRKEILQTFLSMIPAIRQEKGCRCYRVFQDIEDENAFSLIGEWETREDLAHHLKSDRFGVLLGSKILLRKDQEIQIHTVSHTEGSGFVNALRGKRT